MNKLINYDFDGNNIRTVKVNDEVWFVANDVATSLDYAKVNDAIRKNVSKKDIIWLSWREYHETSVGHLWGRHDYSNKRLINESGIFALTLHSNLPEAQKFKDWVTGKVLPSIKRTGGYSIKETSSNDSYMINDPIKRAQAWINEEKERQTLKIANKQLEMQSQFTKDMHECNGTILVYRMAKLLQQSGINVGGIELFQWLRDNRFLCNRHGRSYNAPTAYAVSSHLMINKESIIDHKNGYREVRNTPLITGHGQVYFYNRFMKIQRKQQNVDDISLLGE